MQRKIRLGAVSYLNTKPLLYGISRAPFSERVVLSLAYPARLAAELREGIVDIALLPVAAMKDVPGARIVGGYGIAADGPVASVCLFSRVPLEEIETVYLDYQSRTSVMLVQYLFQECWKRAVEFLPAPEDYISRIDGAAAGVIIGDRALELRDAFPYVYDLAGHWNAATGKPFIFAGWVSAQDFPDEFVQAFDAANAEGLSHLDEIVQEIDYPHYDLKKYYTENIRYELTEERLEGMKLFLDWCRAQE